MDYDALEIRLVDEASNELYCWYGTAGGAENVDRWRSPLDDGVSGWVVRHNQAQLVNEIGKAIDAHTAVSIVL